MPLSVSRAQIRFTVCTQIQVPHIHTTHSTQRSQSARATMLRPCGCATRAATDAADRSRPGPRARTAWHSPRSRPIEYLRHLYSKQMKPGHPERNPNANPNSVHEAERLRLRAHRSCAELPRHAAPDHCAVIARELPVSLVTRDTRKRRAAQADEMPTTQHLAARGASFGWLGSTVWPGEPPAGQLAQSLLVQT